MCQHKNNINLYSNTEILKWLENPPLELVNVDVETELKQILYKLFRVKENQMPTLHPYLFLWIESRMMKQNQLGNVRKSFDSSVKANVYNFSLAKCFQFLQGIKFLKQNDVDESALKNYSNTIFSTQQATEEYQVSHLTTNITTYEESDLLEFITSKDGKVRTEHKNQDGIVRPKTDKYWSSALALLSDYNCRCSIETATKGSKLSVAPTINVKTLNPPSDINLQTGKAIIFKEELPVFQNTQVIRNKFKRSGF